MKTKKVRRKKITPGEEANEESFSDKKQKFEVEVFKTILNNELSTLNERYYKNKDLIYDVSLFDPRNFIKKTVDSIVPDSSIKSIANLAGKIHFFFL